MTIVNNITAETAKLYTHNNLMFHKIGYVFDQSTLKFDYNPIMNFE